MKTIIHVVDIGAPRDKVYTALTQQDALSSWWTKKVSVEGDEVQFMFVPDIFNPRMKVTQKAEAQTVHWRCIGGVENWKDNTFSFDLQGSNGSTRLKFVQNYAQELDDDVYGVYNFNWAYYLDSLRQYLETGTGKPFTGELNA